MDDYPLLNVFLSMLWFFLWVMWFFLLFKVCTDIFRDRTMGGWGKAGWLVFVLVLPYLGVFVYLIARGRSMGERDVEQLKEQDAAFREYVRKAAGGQGGGSTVDELHRLAALKDKGDISPAEFERAKAQVLAGAGGGPSAGAAGATASAGTPGGPAQGV
ncbi:SHOCT domain-containing protein [Streptomyces zhihengii]|uniref:SHOCT domain-containing protein n=1 Tax=Streptomyces zhihengii TaxID=1818004 RepID=A0ABS2UJW2_9ACTN|nr:SHOCT domain-containing protein [Streptomyces zhihengii]MBM9617827.1 SHOCT domain-containing protein [Streptomyces zhihengii]